MISSPEGGHQQFFPWTCNFFETYKKPLLKDKLQEEQTILLLQNKEDHEGLAIQLVKQISFLILKFFLRIFMKTQFIWGLSQFEEKKLYYYFIRLITIGSF